MSSEQVRTGVLAPETALSAIIAKALAAGDDDELIVLEVRDPVLRFLDLIIERGVAGAIGERVGATLYEKGYSPKRILHEIKEGCGLSPMQLYWQVIVPKL